MKLQPRQLWVSLTSNPNPDILAFGSTSVASLEVYKNIDNVYFGVKSLEEASVLCRRYIDHFGLGSGNWTGGLVIDESGLKVGRISYNGRIWAD